LESSIVACESAAGLCIRCSSQIRRCLEDFSYDMPKKKLSRELISLEKQMKGYGDEYRRVERPTRDITGKAKEKKLC